MSEREKSKANTAEEPSPPSLFNSPKILQKQNKALSAKIASYKLQIGQVSSRLRSQEARLQASYQLNAQIGSLLNSLIADLRTLAGVSASPRREFEVKHLISHTQTESVCLKDWEDDIAEVLNQLTKAPLNGHSNCNKPLNLESDPKRIAGEKLKEAQKSADVLKTQISSLEQQNADLQQEISFFKNQNEKNIQRLARAAAYEEAIAKNFPDSTDEFEVPLPLSRVSSVITPKHHSQDTKTEEEPQIQQQGERSAKDVEQLRADYATLKEEHSKLEVEKLLSQEIIMNSKAFKTLVDSYEQALFNYQALKKENHKLKQSFQETQSKNALKLAELLKREQTKIDKLYSQARETTLLKQELAQENKILKEGQQTLKNLISELGSNNNQNPEIEKLTTNLEELKSRLTLTMKSLETRLKESTQKLHQTLKRNQELSEKVIKYKTEAERYKWSKSEKGDLDKNEEYKAKYEQLKQQSKVS